MMNSASRRPKLAIIYGPLLHYRIALFDALSERYDLTVFTTAFVGPRAHLGFKVEVIRPWRIGSFQVQPGLRGQLRHGRFDSCISFVDVRHIDSLAAVFFPVAPQMFCWGVWLTRSEMANRIRLAAVNRCEAAVFYCQQHLEQIVARGVDPDRLYVAPNTVAMPHMISPSPPEARDSILFVGSFTARKGLDRLLRLFASALPEMPGRVRFVLVGDGPEQARLVTLVSDLGLADRVEMPGRVNDPDALAPYYARALVSV
ncbi:MAG: glycosyltransferase, partial [Xanthomonadales bacterium]|nr:glycosyltransferase [Xanthomonadales bacterium]